MFAVVARDMRTARMAMEKLEDLGVFNPSMRSLSKSEVVLVTPLSDPPRGYTIHDGVVVDGWDEELGTSAGACAVDDARASLLSSGLDLDACDRLAL